MKLYVIDHDGVEHQIDGIDGWQLMEVIRDEGLDIKAECGGSCACATCHVYVDEEWQNKVPEKSEEEIDMLDLAFDVQDNSRLSCQITITPSLDGLRVTLAPD
ncbi:MAG: ferredoxin [Rhodospirillaceae bacterium]|nr:ferredoxin [Rhodospirillaceae bacterium]|tara:strand:- start:301 stop:609 length:309 start_codon:yes stop_codon:yes gene_type:complete